MGLSLGTGLSPRLGLSCSLSGLGSEGLAEQVSDFTTLLSELNAVLFLQPNATNGPGYNAISGNNDFSHNSVVDGYTVSDNNMELVTLSSSDALTADSGFGVGVAD